MNDLYRKTRSTLIYLCGGLSLMACGNAAPDGEIGQETSSTVQTAEPVDTFEAAEPETPGDTTSAPQTEESEVRQVGSHTHGDANLAIVLEGDSLTIELETPLFNLTGFEHEPETVEEVAALEATEEKLKQSEVLFSVNEEAQCAPADGHLDIHLTNDEHDDHEEHAEEDHEAEEHHETEEHHEAEGHHEAEERHQDVLVTYMFQCETPQRLSEIDITLLSMFPSITELEVAYLGPAVQRLFTLDQTSTRINLRP